MPERETLPKTKKSADWLGYADKKLREFKDYHAATNLLGQPKNPPPLQDDYSRLLSQNELQARKMGMDLLRREAAAGATAPAYRKGGRAKKTGPAELHKGEMVERKTPRKKPRKVSR